jgi:hypothetical protein
LHEEQASLCGRLVRDGREILQEHREEKRDGDEQEKAALDIRFMPVTIAAFTNLSRAGNLLPRGASGACCQ